MRILIFIFVLSFLLTCNPYNEDNDIDNQFSIGQSVLYINNIESSVNWRQLFRRDTFFKRMELALILKEKDDLIINSLSFYNFKINKLGIQTITENSQILNGELIIEFNQTVDEDLRGYEYELQKNENNLFDLIAIDTLRKDIDFKFRLHYNCCKKNNNIYSTEEEWPKYIKFEGHYHDNYK